MAQYKVGRVPFASVLEGLSGFQADLVGFYESVAATQRIDIAQREFSLDPVAAPALERSVVEGAESVTSAEAALA